MTPNAQLEPRDSDRGTSGEHAPTVDETSRLLPPAAQDAGAAAVPAPSRAFQLRVQLMCAVFLFIIDVSVFIIDPPTQQILEDIICRDRYGGNPSVLLAKGPGSPCKSPDVQSKLAMFTSIQALFGTLCPLLVQVPYGLLADHSGRRLVLFLSIAGLTLMVTWNIFILWFSDIFSIWLMIPGYILLFIGGGATMVAAMVWTIVTDVTREEERSSVFYQLVALTLIISASTNPLTAWLMNYSPWLPTFLGTGLLYVACFFVLLMPETRLVGLALKDVPDSPDGEVSTDEDSGPGVKADSMLSAAWHKFTKYLAELWQFVIADKKIMALCVCEAVSTPIATSMVLFALQYIAVPLGSWSKALTLLTISKVTSVILLLGILPLSTHVILKYSSINRMKLDVYLARTSAVLLTLAMFAMGLADTEWELICALIIYGLSQGFSAQMRVLITAMVEPHMVATVNTTMSTLQSVMVIITTPLIGWLLGRGMEIGGVWTGLAYIVLAAMGCLVSIILCLLRL
ncbi:unnamed protein product [Clonostachys rhizophaga]|uniref:Major facilitator superfamily (MFS) profile domain-containing protein n=1 Tax=Clonostachys rhizophaga TaxID=160324 RepID=A0A9N9VAW3_9HYPO|nr:unnamed protein product [Clonostachys rhizophaga]